MTFTPNSKIYLGSVPFDPGYKHVIYIPDREQQRAQIAARCTFGLNREDYTYQRLNNSLKVPYNAEQLYGLNYCMFQNANYGTRWFYSFITDIEYVSESTSRIYLKEDVFQTWFLDANVQTCYVEREHVNDDSIGRHIKDEGINPGEHICQYTWEDKNNALYIVAASAAEPQTNGDYVNVAGDMYMHMPSGCSLTVFGSMSDMQEWMKALADNGQQDAISNVYMVPSDMIDANGLVRKSDGWGYWMPSNSDVQAVSKSVDLGFTTLNGYTPKNNKMYCYPFEYCEMTNYMGETQQLRLEFMDSATLQLEKTGGVDVNAHCSYVPLNYNGIPKFWEGSVNLGAYPTCQWVYATRANEYGRSRFDVATPVGNIELNAHGDLGYMKMASGAASDLISSVTSVGDALLSMGMPGKAGSAKALRQGEQKASMGTNVLGNLAQTWLGLANDYLDVQADLGKVNRMPSTSRGTTNTSVNQISVRNYGIAVRKYVCRAEFAKMCDDYLSAYGYNVSEFKQPNLTGRASWNYVKTIGMQLHGKIPATAMQDLETMFDTGVTLWHTWDVGNYSLDNSII